MYAIVEIAGHQYKVQKDQQIFVNRLQDDEGAKVQFDDVLLIEDGGKVTVGAPVISGAAVTAKVERHLKGDKVIVFKKKRRKGYKKKNGFRAYLTEIKIEGIVASGAKASKKAALKKETTPKAAAPKKEVVAKAAAPKVEKPKAAPVKSSKPDDLKKVEGIGPKIAGTLNEAGINTFQELANTSAEKIAEIISGVRGNHITTTWPKQAQMAAEGKWDELKVWQDEMDGGKPTE